MFVDSYKHLFHIDLLCKCIGLSRSLYYYHKSHPTNSYQLQNDKLDILIKQIWLDSKKIYGSPKITKVLLSKGFHVSQKRVAKRMKLLGIRSIVIKKRRPSISYKFDHSKSYPNLLQQDFYALKPGSKWVGDITYIYTVHHGWVYLATVMDLFDRSIIGFDFSKSMSTSIAINALNMAISNRSISNLIFHSDRGSQYTSNLFEKTLLDLNIKHSYSKKGYPYDNSSMESFNSLLKKELVYTTKYFTFHEAKSSILDYIHWYNNIRIHSYLDFVSPSSFFINYSLS